jgi:hypothetical protein
MNPHDKTSRYADDRTKTATAWGDALRGFGCLMALGVFGAVLTAAVILLRALG